MIMSQHIILSLHDWRATSSGAGQPETSNHELGPVSYAGHYPGGPSVGGGAGGRRPGQLGAAQNSSVVPGFSSHSNPNAIKSVQLGRDRRNSRVLESQNGVRSFMRSKRGSSEEGEDEERGNRPLEIKVNVEEEVKLDYDSMYTDPDADLAGRDRHEVSFCFVVLGCADGGLTWHSVFRARRLIASTLLCDRALLLHDPFPLSRLSGISC